MTKEEAVKFYGSQSKLAKALGINPASVSQWGDDVPALRAFQIERLTNGKLKAGALQLPNAHQAA